MTSPKKALDLAPAIALKDVEWRVDGKPYDARGGGYVARFVPYVDASTTARLLDEWVGPGNWSDSYIPGEVAGKPALWCHLQIKVDGEWVVKRDVGVASNFEPQKGMVSDAFKRAACLKWGVARNVYELPTLWAPCDRSKKGDAIANDKTLPSLHQQLGRLGFEATGRIREEAEDLKADSVAGSEPTTPGAAAAREPSASSEDTSPASPPQGDKNIQEGGEGSSARGGAHGEPATLLDATEDELNRKDELQAVIEQAKEAGIVKWSDIARVASPVALQQGARVPGKWADLKDQPLRVLETVVKHLHLDERVPA